LRVSGARTLLARDRAEFISAGSLLALSAVAWAALLLEPNMPMARSGAAEVLTFLAAWGLMMAAMMLPSATPMISLYGALHRNASATAGPGIPTALFTVIYLLMWLAFGLPVYIASVIVSSQTGLADVLPYALA